MATTRTRRVNLIALLLVSVVCLLLLLSSGNSNSSSSGNNIYDGSPTFPVKHSRPFGEPLDGGHYHHQPHTGLGDPPKRVVEVLAAQREALQEEMTGFPLPDNRPLSQLAMESGGQPVRSLVITTWRSGSTFLGDILNTLPGNYYHYEPMMHYDIRQVRDEPLATKAVGELKSLLQCDYSGLGEYLSFNEDHTYTFKHNTRLWDQCLEHPHLCWRPRFLSAFCKLFPLQSMKVVRLRLNIAARLLEDKE